MNKYLLLLLVLVFKLVNAQGIDEELSLFNADQYQSVREQTFGRVILTQGDPYRFKLNGEQQELHRRDGVEQGDILVTDADDFLQLRITDASMIALNCNSSLEVLQYMDSVSVEFEMVLNKGSFRSISGEGESIIYTNAAKLSVNSEGVTFEIVEESSDSILLAVYSGSVAIGNTLNSFQLSDGIMRLSQDTAPQAVSQNELDTQRGSNCPQ